MTDWLGALRQTERWTTKDGRELALEEMTPAHRDNLVAMYHRKAVTLKRRDDVDLICLVDDHAPVLTFPDGSSASMINDAVDDMLNARIDEDPHAWLDRQPLIRRLRELNAAVTA